ncbi:MAG TPA: rRNA maturation RNase YbeY [Steroidobacteraceae bacterium]|nr:rRNA maturation RNase YbeY [Steroidobacteraceae bacterium]
MRISVRRAVRAGWLPPAQQLRGWAAAALGRAAAGRELSVLLAGRARSRALNARYRGRDRATNVLSFPAPADAAAVSGLLGELVICPAVLRAEARAQHKRERAHWAHMVVHGVLHLAGYDHELPAAARRMERREIRTLRRLGIANPYRIAPRARSARRGRAQH